MSLTEKQKARAIVHAAINGDATVLRIVCKQSEAFSIDDFILLDEAITYAKEAGNTDCYNYLVTIGAHLWAPCKQISSAIKLESYTLLRHVCDTFEKQHNQSLIAALMSHDATGEAICLNAISSHKNGKCMSSVIKKRVAFLEQHLSGPDMRYVLSHRYSHHFYDNNLTRLPLTGVSKLSPLDLANVIAKAKSLNIKRHIFNHAFYHLSTDDFIIFFQHLTQCFTSTHCYESSGMWFVDSATRCDLYKLYNEVADCERSGDRLMQFDIGIIHDNDIAVMRSLNHSYVYQYFSQVGSNNITQHNGKDTLFSFMVRCCLTDGYKSHPFWQSLKEIDHADLAQMIYYALTQFTHPEHWRVIQAHFPFILQSSKACIQDKLSLTSIVEHYQTRFALSYRKNIEHSEKQALLAIQLYDLICEQICYQPIKEQADYLAQIKELLCISKRRIDGLLAVYRLPDEVGHCALSELDDPMIMRIILHKQPPLYWLEKDVNSDIKGRLLQQLSV